MRKFSLIILFGLFFFLISGAHSFESDREDDDVPAPSDDIQCWNFEDDDADGDAPPGGDPENVGRGPFDVDSGCVNPYWEDPNEGMIWDTHLTAEMEGLSTGADVFDEGSDNPDPMSTESIFFDNTVYRGDYSDQEEWEDNTNNENKLFNFVDAQRGEDSVDEEIDGVELNAYGFGYPRDISIDQNDLETWDREGVEQDPEITENRVIDTPHGLSSACGNGLEDVISDNARENTNSLGDEDGYTGGDFINCRGDYGRILLKYDMDGNEDSVEHNYGNDDLECRNDDGNADADGTTGSCGSCGGSSNTGSASCEGDYEDYGDQEGTNYYENPGDLIEEYRCTRDSTCGGSGASSGCDDHDSYRYISSCNSHDCGPCGNDTRYSVGSRTTQHCGQGDTRSWSGVQDSICADSEYSVVDGGGRTNNNRMDNDPAATYTRFTSYADNSWTDSDNERSVSDDTPNNWNDGSGKVWAGYDFAATINPDGPEGNGDGFIVIDENAGSNSNDIDRVVGRESPNGEDTVGRNVHYGVREAGENDGSATERLDYDFIDMVDLECPGDKTVCIRYVDFWVDGPGETDGTPGDPHWTIDESNPSNPSDSDIRNALRADSEAITLDEGYSACKAANRIAELNPESIASDIDWENNDDAVRGELVDCDYMREEGGEHRNIAPLPEACGDEDDEHLMVMEGSSVDGDTSEQWLGHEQACVDWDDEVDDNGRDLTSSACVNQGDAWAEGTVMNVASERNGEYPYTTEGWEEGGDSPDWQVCLDIDDYVEDDAPRPYNHRHNDPDNDHYGGQWYDLDDERINEYLRNNENNLPESIDSSTAGEENQEIDYIDYYYTENPNPQHNDYNPKGGLEGTALIADCGPGLLCGDNEDEDRGDVSSATRGDGVYFGFSDTGQSTFDRWSRDEDYHPQGMWSRDQNEEIGDNYNIISGEPEESRQEERFGNHIIEPRTDYLGYLVRSESASDQLGTSNPDYDNHDWWFNTYVDEDSAVQYAYAEGPDWAVDSTGVPYPPGGSSESAEYLVGSDSEAGNHRHIDYDNSPRSSWEQSSIEKTDKAHGNSIIVVANDNNDHGFDEGQAYWIDPDDIFEEWENDNIDRSYW